MVFLMFIFLDVPPPSYFNWHPQFSVNYLFQKKTKWGIEDILSWKLPLEFLIFNFLTPWNSTLKSSPFVFFFSGIAQWQLLRWYTHLAVFVGSFCWYQICRSQVLNFQILFYHLFKLFLGDFFGQNSPKCCQFCLTNDDMQDNTSDMLRFLLKY